MGTELPTKVMLGQTLVLMQITFLNNVRRVGRLVLPRTYYSLSAFSSLPRKEKEMRMTASDSEARLCRPVER
jgi:hypothetical protein